MHASLIIFCTLFGWIGCVPMEKETSEVRIDSGILIEDLSILQTSLQEAHPGLYWYTDKDSMDSLFDNTRKAINRDMTTMEFFSLLLPVIAEIKCSHTNIRLPEDVQQQLESQYMHFLPFEFYFRDEKAFIRRTLNGPDLAGNELLTINGIPMQQILDRLLSTIPADGYNQSFKYNVLSRGVITEAYAMHYGESHVYAIETKDPTGQLNKLDVPAATVDQVRAGIPDPLPIFSLQYHERIAILSIHSFLIDGQSFADSITSIFRTLKEQHIQKLIIDIRQNGGGNNENVSALFAAMARAPFRHLRQAEILGRPLTFAVHITNAGSLDQYSREMPRDDRFIINNSYAGTRLMQPRHDIGFTGAIVLLTSANTNSAASEFAAIFHHHQRGKIVGEETGGCYYGSTGGTYLRLQLPGSRLNVTIPTVRIFNDVGDDYSRQPAGRGTFPDFVIVPDIADVIEGRDVQMERALEVLR